MNGISTLVLPAAVEENLAQALSYDLDRHTPFRPEQLYFDAAVIDRNPAAKTISVDWVAALKTAVDSARRQVEDWGGVVVAVVPGPASTRPTRLNLVPHEARPQPGLWRRWQLWAPAALVAVGATLRIEDGVEFYACRLEARLVEPRRPIEDPLEIRARSRDFDRFLG